MLSLTPFGDAGDAGMANANLGGRFANIDIDKQVPVDGFFAATYVIGKRALRVDCRSISKARVFIVQSL